MTRTRADREAPPSIVAPENALAALEALVRSALEAGAVELADVTVRVLPALPPELHYVATGRIADVLANIRRVHSERERPWRPVLDRLEIEDWSVNTDAVRS